jgi:hypothetical protein
MKGRLNKRRFEDMEEIRAEFPGGGERHRDTGVTVLLTAMYGSPKME